MAFDRDKLKADLAALAAKGVFLGTSSWKYPGWFGQLYERDRYIWADILGAPDIALLEQTPTRRSSPHTLTAPHPDALRRLFPQLDILGLVGCSGNGHNSTRITDMVPIGSDIEYLKAIPASQNLSREKRDAAIVAVQDPSLILGFAPERGTQAADVLRIVILAIIFRFIERTKSERYREVDASDPHKPEFAAGFEQCLEMLATDNNISSRIQQRIEETYASEGTESLKTRIEEALKSNDFVPSSVLKRFRETLSQELRRLDSALPAALVACHRP